ncbi:MAG: hypothetical protein QF664_12820 [Dehalococcoidia bacterium]|jgi:hypothetical protein|nr:hypothetical protein [Dehalococcoidia bacterium]
MTDVLEDHLNDELDPELELALSEEAGALIGGDGDVTGDLPEAALDELAALAEAEATAADAEQAAQAEELAAAQRVLEAERARTRSAVARYRDAVLAAEPDLPPELVTGETLEELDASLDAARRAVRRFGSASASRARVKRAAASPSARRRAADRRRRG